MFLRKAVSDDDMANLIKGIVTLSPGKGAEILSRCWKTPRFLYRLYQTVLRMEKIRKLYMDYPQTPEEFLSWKRKVDLL